MSFADMKKNMLEKDQDLKHKKETISKLNKKNKSLKTILIKTALRILFWADPEKKWNCSVATTQWGQSFLREVVCGDLAS